MNNVKSTQKQQFAEQSQSDLKILFIVLAIIAFFTLVVIFIYTLWFKQLFQRYQANLGSQQREIVTNSKQLKLTAGVF
jgi:flagellar basal body-associated protein FliL